jgi:hypothetical protein
MGTTGKARSLAALALVADRYREVTDSRRFWPMIGACNSALLLVNVVLWCVRVSRQ